MKNKGFSAQQIFTLDKGSNRKQVIRPLLMIVLRSPCGKWREKTGGNGQSATRVTAFFLFFLSRCRRKVKEEEEEGEEEIDLKTEDSKADEKK